MASSISHVKCPAMTDKGPCNRKIYIAVDCKCQKAFCYAHKQQHNCTYNALAAHRVQLQSQKPTVDRSHTYNTTGNNPDSAC